MKAKFAVLIGRMESGAQLQSPQLFRKEGKTSKSTHFYAIRALPLRAYGWYSGVHPGVFYISHYVYKDRGDLSKADEQRVHRAWRAIEHRHR